MSYKKRLIELLEGCDASDEWFLRRLFISLRDYNQAKAQNEFEEGKDDAE